MDARRTDRWPGSVVGRISMGFLAVLLLHACVVVLSSLGLDSAGRSAAESQARHAELTLALQNDRKVVALQRCVLAYMYSGDADLAKYVSRQAAELEVDLQAFASGVDVSAQSEPDERELREMVQALRNYRAGFENVIHDRGAREQLLRSSVFPANVRIRAAAEAVLHEANRADRAALSHGAGACLLAFSEASAAISSYLVEPGGAAVREFQRSAALGREALQALDTEGLSSGPRSEVQAALAELPNWERAFLSVVTATRSYLHLVNVVLAGQALEFLTLSSSFTQRQIVRQAEATARLEASRLRFHRLSDGVGLFTVLAGLAAGWCIARSVSRPITALTATLSGLALGQDEEIAGQDRNDEIGAMARAAKVFAARNQETKQLLVAANQSAQAQAQLNLKLGQSLKELERRNEDLDSFSYSASHDLRAPLRSIALLAEWARADAGDALPEASVLHLSRLGDRVHRLEALLDGLLAYCRTGRTVDHCEDLELLSLIRETVDPFTDDASVSLEVRGENLCLSAPRVAVQKIVQNLVANAIEHHQGGAPSVEVTVEARGDEAVITVRDDGPGIPPALQERAFQIFQTLKPRDDHESSGIGLAIVQKLCEANGARVELQSDGKSGCAFHVFWRLVPVSTVEDASCGEVPRNEVGGLSLPLAALPAASSPAHAIPSSVVAPSGD